MSISIDALVSSFSQRALRAFLLFIEGGNYCTQTHRDTTTTIMMRRAHEQEKNEKGEENHKLIVKLLHKLDDRSDIHIFKAMLEATQTYHEHMVKNKCHTTAECDEFARCKLARAKRKLENACDLFQHHAMSLKEVFRTSCTEISIDSIKYMISFVHDRLSSDEVKYGYLMELGKMFTEKKPHLVIDYVNNGNMMEVNQEETFTACLKKWQKHYEKYTSRTSPMCMNKR